MKKTAQTLLTAAMFATALGNSAANASTGSAAAFAAERAFSETTAPFTTTEDVTTMTSAPLYGPPWVLSSLEEERQKTATTTTTTETDEPGIGTEPEDNPWTTTMRPEDDPTYTAPVVLYGPPWVFYPKGDVTMDNKTDARDLTLIKRAAIGGSEAVEYTEYQSADVNHDGVVDKEDVRIFREDVLGIPPKEEEPVTTTTVTESPDVTTTTTVDSDLKWDTWEDLHPGQSRQTTMPPQN